MMDPEREFIKAIRVGSNDKTHLLLCKILEVLIEIRENTKKLEE